MSCSVTHPEHAERGCILTTATHARHMTVHYVEQGGGMVPVHLSWPNEDYTSRAEQRQQSRQAQEKVSQLAQQAREAQPEPVDTGLKPLRRKSAQGRVAAFLLDHIGEWVPGRRFTDPGDINGGAEGLRRVRQLAEDYGWPIEHRPDPNPNTFVDQYRLTHRPHDVEII